MTVKKEAGRMKKKAFKKDEKKRITCGVFLYFLVVKSTLHNMHPSSWLCPLSKTLMTDPVISAADGYTYERAAIVQW